MYMRNPPPFPLKMLPWSIHQALRQWNHPAFRSIAK